MTSTFRHPALLLLVAFLWTGAEARAQSSTPEAMLTAMLHHFLDGASRSDAAIHDAFWAEDLIYTSSSGRRFGKAELMAGLPPEPIPPTTRYTAEEIQVRVFGGMAVVAFRMVATSEEPTLPPVQQFFNSGTFLLREGRWQVVNWHATRIPSE